MGSYHRRVSFRRTENSEHHPLAVLTGGSFDWKQTIPTRLALLQTGFVQPNLAHSFHQEACFETALILILKSGQSNSCDTLNLLLVQPFHACLASTVVHFSEMISHSYKIIMLRLGIPNYDQQEQVPPFLACLLHFELDISLLMKYLGNNYTGAS